MDINFPEQLKNAVFANGFSEKQSELSLESICQLSSIRTFLLTIEVGLSSSDSDNISDFFTTVLNVCFDYPPCDFSPEQYFINELKNLFISDILHDYPDFNTVYHFKILDCCIVYSYPMGVQIFTNNSVEVNNDVE